MVACELHDCTVVSLWQFNTSAGAAVTVNDALHVAVPHPKEEVVVNVTVFVPPHLSGAPVLLFVSVPFAPLANANHVA